jgi:ABC-type multidrug transport system ATPase subunit
MEDIGIIDKRHALAYTLSGGNKRRLSVAIALCG